MYKNKLVAVVVPCYNEETQIANVIKTMPDFVDRIVVVDDGSKDKTLGVVFDLIRSGKYKKTLERKTKANEELENSHFNRANLVVQQLIYEEGKWFEHSEIAHETQVDKIICITQKNSGVGSAIATGYRWCRDNCIDCTAVMAGDGQMDPSELRNLVAPIIDEKIDYVKGNRLIHKSAKLIIPGVRLFGNSVLSMLTKIASGYWSISDTQTGYTAISLEALQSIDIHKIYPSYGCPNDILVKLNMAYCTIREIPIKPVYNVGENSKMKIGNVIPRVSWLLLKSFFKRISIKYFLTDFHPLSLFYYSGIVLGTINIPLFVYIFTNVIINMGSVTQGVYIVFVLLTLFSFQSIGFGMWMDIQNNEKLNK